MAKGQHNSVTDQSTNLGGSWPDFLNRITTDPDRCFREFYSFSTKLLQVCPPGPVRALNDESRQDLLHDLVLHCCRNNFKVLGGYSDQGRPFAAWLQLVARNKALDLYRSSKRSAAMSVDDPGDNDLEIQIPDGRPAVDDEIDRRETIASVKQALQKLSSKCRILVQGAAEGCKPRELVQLMGWPPDWNKKASDDLRECRRRLLGLLEDSGLDPKSSF